MRVSKIYDSLLNVVEQYRSELNAISADQFQVSPAANVWSYSEVFHHVFDMSLLGLLAIKKIAKGEGTDGAISLAGNAILTAGMFPPAMRFLVPAQLDGRVRKIDKPDTFSMIERFESDLKSTVLVLASCHKDKTIEHPRLGFLNAQQWLRFTEIHLIHHLKQIGRIHAGDAA